MKVLFLDKFRRKTPEEKVVKEYLEQLKKNAEIHKYMRMG